MERNLEGALRDLTQGIPGGNDAHPTGTGELDNGRVRHLLAAAAFQCVRDLPPKEAFDALSSFVATARSGDWFETRRAELLLEMLLYQTGWSECSTWNASRETELRLQRKRPDQRWLDVCRHVPLAPPGSERLHDLAKQLGERLRSMRAGE